MCIACTHPHACGRGSSMHCRSSPGSSLLHQSPCSALYDPVGWIPYRQVDQGLRYGHIAEVRLAALICLLTEQKSVKRRSWSMEKTFLSWLVDHSKRRMPSSYSARCHLTLQCNIPHFANCAKQTRFTTFQAVLLIYDWPCLICSSLPQGRYLGNPVIIYRA